MFLSSFYFSLLFVYFVYDFILNKNKINMPCSMFSQQLENCTCVQRASIYHAVNSIWSH